MTFISKNLPNQPLTQAKPTHLPNYTIKIYLISLLTIITSKTVSLKKSSTTIAKSSQSPQKLSILKNFFHISKKNTQDTYANITTDDTNLCVAGTESADEDEITVIITDYNHTIDKFHASVTITSQNQQFDITKTIPIQVYVYQTEEVDYQRKGLNEHGWSLLPENCTYSTNYDNLVELVNEGGLSRSFLDNWIEGETALMAWW